jgi:Zn-dependent protease
MAGLTDVLNGALIRIVIFTMQVNVILMVFNLIPIPPLDGSKIMFSILNLDSQTQQNFERFGPFLLLGLIFLPRFILGTSIFGLFVFPVVNMFSMFFLR